MRRVLQEQTYNEILAGDARRRFVQTMVVNRRGMPKKPLNSGPIYLDTYRVGDEGPSFAAAAEL